MNHNKLTLIIFFIAYPIYLDISIEEDVNLIAAIVTCQIKSSNNSFAIYDTFIYNHLYLAKI